MNKKLTHRRGQWWMFWLPQVKWEIMDRIGRVCPATCHQRPL